MEEIGCIGTTLVHIALLLYTNDIVLLAISHYDFEKHKRIPKYLCFTIDMSMNINKTKVMIIESKKSFTLISLMTMTT